MSAHVLIAEDEPKIAALLADYMAAAGMRTTIVDDGAEVLAAVAAHAPDVVLLDVMLPHRDGMTLCRELRAQSSVPIVMVTARSEEIDRLLGLELGADDYICKPFSPREVVARVKAVLRRTGRREPSADGGGVTLDEAGYRATIGGRDLGLTAVEFQLLKVLVDHPGRIYTRDQLMDAMYRDERVVSDRTVDSHVKKIRRKIAAVLPERELVHSVYGLGYKFEW